jgi:hypothetical protein
LPEQSIEIGGRRFPCRALRIEVLAEEDDWFDHLRADALYRDDIPGGLARIFLRSETPDQTYEIFAAAVDFETTEK